MPYPIRTGSKLTPKQVGATERAEALTGSRGNVAPEKRAITREDAGAKGTQVLRATHVSAAPTAAQHNALVDDMRALATVLAAMGAKFESP